MVRLFYFILWVVMNYSLRIYFRTIQLINNPKQFFGRTIYVSNHAAAFMDPLVVGALGRPIVFFMTRADIFNKWTNPFLWMAHMLPIYRQLDGENTKFKNDKVFNRSARILQGGRNLLIFGEGFTDDEFKRRLKPVKKGAIRIGFYTLQKYNWKKKVYVAALGCNYSSPNLLRSDLLISTSEKFCLNDYKEAFLENPNRVLNELTKKVGKMMREQITHVDNLTLCPLHENILRLTGKGLHPTESDRSIPLEKRWKYSRELALHMNSNPEWYLESGFDQKLNSFFSELDQKNLKTSDLQSSKNGKPNRFSDLFWSVVLLPFAILHFIHIHLFYKAIKYYVEKNFKRPVFWGSVKLLLGTILIGCVNLPILIYFDTWFNCSSWFGVAYFLSLGLFFIAYLKWKKSLSEYKRKGQISSEELKTYQKKHQSLLQEFENQYKLS